MELLIASVFCFLFNSEALEILLSSLDHAPIEPEHAPVLFFIAESILHMLCYDAVQKPYLFLCEIRLAKVCQTLKSINWQCPDTLICLLLPCICTYFSLIFKKENIFLY